jgi:hypothetical protein
MTALESWTKFMAISSQASFEFGVATQNGELEMTNKQSKLTAVSLSFLLVFSGAMASSTTKASALNIVKIVKEVFKPEKIGLDPGEPSPAERAAAHEKWEREKAERERMQHKRDFLINQPVNR